MRLSPTTTLHIKGFSGGTLTKLSSYVRNGIFSRYPDDRWYVTQRPGINIFEDAADAGVDAKGRGFYYWNAVSEKYIVNNDTVYQSSYAGTTMAISAGTERVYIFEVGDYLVILDPENNEGWSINSSSPTTIAAITFPAALANLAKGGVAMNGTLYVYSTTGDIFESDVEDPTTWGVLNFRNSEVEQDGGVFLAKHHEHIVAVGNRSMEFFYRNPEPPAVGLTLLPRKDINYELGAVDEHSFWSEGDILFWVAQTPSGGVEVQALENFAPSKISEPEMDTFLASSIITDSVKVLGSGFRVGGRIFYALTLYNKISVVVPTETLVFNAKTQTWTLWELMHTGINDCPIADWGKQTKTRTGEGILSNGDLVTVADDFNPQDTTGALLVYEDGVYEAGVYSATDATGTGVLMEVVPGTNDFGTRKQKFMSELMLVGTPPESAQTGNIHWSDESDDDWNAAHPIDLCDNSDSIRRMGRFYQRNIKFTYTGTDQYRLEAFETREKVL